MKIWFHHAPLLQNYDVLIAQILFSEVEVNNGDIKIIKCEIKSDDNTIQSGDNTDEKNCKTQNLCP